MDLCMTVVATSNYITCLGGLDLGVLDLSVFQTLFLKTRLEITTTAAAAKVIALVRISIHKIFFANAGLDNKTNVIGSCVAIGFTDDVARVLNGEFYLKILVPIGTGLESALADPFCVVLIDGSNFEVVWDVVLFQSCQD